ncbi:MAG: SDR family NAD(P)-dependent oxidoreductase [Acetobacteraceae bacterium]|nr:SDR family NAD(P)-dependent oxidoreductase [Acetobacteraceae bacterium]
MLDPSGRVVMVSCASRGIGRAIVEHLLAAGFLVSAGVREPRGLRESETLQVQRYEAESLDNAERWVEAAVARFGTLHGLVNAAGINPVYAVTDADETALDQLWTVNVKGPLRLCRLALPHLRACGTGRIVNLASLSGKRVANRNAGYAISKFAVVALTHALRREGWEDGVRATALCPGFVETDMTMAAQFPREQMSKPQDLAAMAELLLRLPNTAVVAELLVNCRLEMVT